MNGDEIFERVSAAVVRFFEGERLVTFLRGNVESKGSFRSATAGIKSVFCELGHEMGYLVCASGCPGADDGAWLYDLCWYEPKNFAGQPLVLETEMNPGGGLANAAAVDGDFCKLVQARADVRIWFCALPNNDIVSEHVRNCKKQIADFRGSSTGDRYLFIIFDWSANKTSIEKYVY